MAAGASATIPVAIPLAGAVWLLPVADHDLSAGTASYFVDVEAGHVAIEIDALAVGTRADLYQADARIATAISSAMRLELERNGGLWRGRRRRGWIGMIALAELGLTLNPCQSFILHQKQKLSFILPSWPTMRGQTATSTFSTAAVAPDDTTHERAGATATAVSRISKHPRDDIGSEPRRGRWRECAVSVRALTGAAKVLSIAAHAL